MLFFAFELRRSVLRHARSLDNREKGVGGLNRGSIPTACPRVCRNGDETLPAYLKRGTQEDAERS